MTGDRYVTMFQEFDNTLSPEKKQITWLHQVNATPHALGISERVFSGLTNLKRVVASTISRFFVWGGEGGGGNLKDAFYSTHPHTIQELQANI